MPGLADDVRNIVDEIGVPASPRSPPVYLSITEASLAEANRRFERFAAPALQEVHRP